MSDSKDIKDSLNALYESPHWAAEEYIEETLMQNMQNDVNTPRFTSHDPGYTVAFYQGRIDGLKQLQQERKRYLTLNAHPRLNS